MPTPSCISTERERTLDRWTDRLHLSSRLAATIRPAGSFCGRTRREFLWEIGGGFGSVALAGLLQSDGFLARQAVAADGTTPFVNPLAPKLPPLPAKAKNVIFLFMYGGPSHVDTFDYKPDLYPLDGKTIAVKTFGRGGKKNEGRIVGPKWTFHQYGECGKRVSDLFPHLATCVDDIAFIHSMYAESPIHGSAMLMMNSGRLLSGHPCLGTWVTYGLGSENENLPGFVVMLDQKGGPISGAKNWSSGYMPAAFQATVLRADGTPIHDLASPRGHRPGHAPAVARPAAREERGPPGARVPTIPSWPRGSPATSWRSRCSSLRPRRSTSPGNRPRPCALYGIDQPRTADFGRKCLIARRLVERGVRFVQIYSGGAHNDDNWDAHADLVANHTQHAGNTDKPIAGLDQGPEAARPARPDADRLGRRVRPPADRRIRRRAPAATTTRSASRCGWPAAASRGAPASAGPTSWAAPPSRTAFTSRTSMLRSCTSSASTPTGSPTSTAACTRSSSASKGPSRSARSSDLIDRIQESRSTDAQCPIRGAAFWVRCPPPARPSAWTARAAQPRRRRAAGDPGRQAGPRPAVHLTGRSSPRTTKRPGWTSCARGSGAGSSGDYANQFEAAWARTLGAKHCLAVANGTSALITSLAALGVGPGDEVIVPPYTFVATDQRRPDAPRAADLRRHRPGDVSDRCPQDRGGDHRAHGAASCRCTWAARPPIMDAILAVAAKHKIPVLEDACQAHLAEWRGKQGEHAGRPRLLQLPGVQEPQLGRRGGDPHQQRPTCSSSARASRTTAAAPSTAGFSYVRNGANLRMTEFQAALLLQQLTRLEEQSRRREQNAAYLTELLREIPGIAPARMYDGCTRNAYHLYMFRYDPRAVRGSAPVKVPRGASGRGNPVLGRLSAALQGAVPEEHARVPRLSGGLFAQADRRLPRADPLPGQRSALRDGRLADADDAPGPALRHGPDRRGGAEGPEAGGEAGEA